VFFKGLGVSPNRQNLQAWDIIVPRGAAEVIAWMIIAVNNYMRIDIYSWGPWLTIYAAKSERHGSSSRGKKNKMPGIINDATPNLSQRHYNLISNTDIRQAKYRVCQFLVSFSSGFHLQYQIRLSNKRMPLIG